MAFLFLGPNGLDSPRVNGYLVKASSNPFTFYDSPLPGVNTSWDVMRIVCNPELMEVAEIYLGNWKLTMSNSSLEEDCYVYLYLLVPTGRYVVPTGRVIATVSIKVPTGRRMHSNTSRILDLFCHEFQKLIAHLIPMVSLKLLVEHFCNCCRYSSSSPVLLELPSAWLYFLPTTSVTIEANESTHFIVIVK
ncbi:hypothetical protein Tco_0648420 [Tanacetum coccineum]